MHHIYHTEAIILGSRNYGEAGKYYYLFTRDLGMIYASAQGVRKMSSKLRFVLQDFSYVKVDLVKGKDFWRVTSASKTSALEDISKNKGTLRVFSNITRLLKRLLAGEDPNEALFKDVINGLSVLENISSEGELASMEVILVLRILNNLGYIGGGLNIDSLTKSPFDLELVLQVPEKRAEILSHINKALKETQL
jgi:DNA repair protein RecO